MEGGNRSTSEGPGKARNHGEEAAEGRRRRRRSTQERKGQAIELNRDRTSERSKSSGQRRLRRKACDKDTAV